MKHRNCSRYEEKAISGIKKAIRGTMMAILGIAIAALLGFVTMWLWNKLMTDIFDLRSIKYFEAVGLFILAKIFFGGFGGNRNRENCDVRREISQEIGEEIEKEIDEKIEKEGMKDNEEYDKVYEEWWQKKGEKSFNDFMNGEKY